MRKRRRTHNLDARPGSVTVDGQMQHLLWVAREAQLAPCYIPGVGYGHRGLFDPVTDSRNR